MLEKCLSESIRPMELPTRLAARVDGGRCNLECQMKGGQDAKPRLSASRMVMAPRALLLAQLAHQLQQQHRRYHPRHKRPSWRHNPDLSLSSRQWVIQNKNLKR